MDEMNENNIAGFFLDGWYVFDNFAPFQVLWRGKLYPTSEHAYQAAHFFATNPDLGEEIRGCLSPKDASDLATKNKSQDDPDWKNKRVPIMEEILRCKQEQHELVRNTLMKSGSKYIVEMNDNDAFWGWGNDHKGQNELGKIWMRLRDELNQKH